MFLLNMRRQILFVVLLVWVSMASAVVKLPAIERVVDQTNTLTAYEKEKLTQRLRNHEEKSGAQIAVVIIPSTYPESIEQYAVRLEEEWKLGRKNIDDGVLLIIAKQDRALRIEVGYGLEGTLTDVVCKRIISELIVPAFKQGNFYDGVNKGLDQIIKSLEGENLPKPAVPVDANDLLLFLLATSFIGFVFAYFKTTPGINKQNTVLVLASIISAYILVYYYYYSIFISLPFCLWSAFVTVIFNQQIINKLSDIFKSNNDGKGNGSDWGNFDSGSGWGSSGSSSSGDSFSGGGGSSGGGGASGRW